MVKELIEQLRPVKWLVLKGSGVPLIVGYGIKQWTVIAAQRYPDNIVMRACVMYATDEGSKGVFGVDEDQYFKSARKLFANLDVLEKIYRGFETDEANFYKSTALPFVDFIKAYDQMYSSGIMIDGFLVYSDAFLQEIKTKYPEKVVEIEILTAPYGLNFAQREKLSLLSIALKIKTGDVAAVEQEKLLLEHQQNFHWIQNNYKNAKGLSMDYFAQQLESLLDETIDELEAEQEVLTNHEARHHQQINNIQTDELFDTNDYDRLLWLGRIASWMDRRKACNLIANYYIGRRAEEIAKERDLPCADIVFLMPEELEEILEGRKALVDFPTAERRREMALVYSIDGGGQIFTGAEAAQVREIIDPEIEHESKEISGNIACRGKARGIVRVVFDPHKQAVFNNGDILVAGMTRPDFLGLMRKAGAFVTDEGGVTCHAAIVAREMGKPCIIGTKIATKVLKDGMMIEVDADNGIVRKLK